MPFRILEAEECVGGSLRTDRVEGFRLDRSFPFHFIAAPELRRLLDGNALDLRRYSRAVLVRCDGRFHRVGDPRLDPGAAVKSFIEPLGTRRDLLRLLRLFQTLEAASDPAQFDERLALDWLRWNGRFSPAFIDRFFRPLSGLLFLDRSLAASSRAFRFALQMLAAGPLAVPSLGMQAIVDQLAAQLPAGSIRFGAKVERIGHREVALVDGEVLRTRAVVVTQPQFLEEEPAARWRGTALLHYAADRPPLEEPILALDGDGGGPVNHLAVLSNLSSEFAPAGKTLIAAGTIGNPSEDDAELDRRTRVQLAEWFGADALGWRLLRIARNPRALPDRTAGTLDAWQRPVRLRPGLYACGMERATATLDGAATSGFRAAQAAMEDLHARLT